MLRLYERVISEHLDSWYRDLSHDEEFLQVLDSKSTTERRKILNSTCHHHCLHHIFSVSFILTILFLIVVLIILILIITIMIMIIDIFTQEMRKIFRDATTELLTRLTRVCICLFHIVHIWQLLQL